MEIGLKGREIDGRVKMYRRRREKIETLLGAEFDHRQILIRIVIK